jgi:hypothetical protein
MFTAIRNGVGTLGKCNCIGKLIRSLPGRLFVKSGSAVCRQKVQLNAAGDVGATSVCAHYCGVSQPRVAGSFQCFVGDFLVEDTFVTLVEVDRNVVHGDGPSQ